MNEVEALALTGVEELAKDLALAELPIYIKYLRGRVAHWETDGIDGKIMHAPRIAFLNWEIKESNAIIVAIGGTAI